MTSTSPLQSRRKAFVTEYLKNGRNGTQAAIVAGYSPKYADRTAYRLLHEIEIRRLIEETDNKLAEADEITLLSWRERVMSDWNSAREAGNWSAAASMQVTMGRHLGALEDQGRASEFEKAALAWLGGKMAEQVVTGRRLVDDDGVIDVHVEGE